MILTDTYKVSFSLPSTEGHMITDTSFSGK